ncbi:hypothetical protein [Citrobacter portucalensis]|uniref:hypothetical protein n=1 Tax=Citrobacter portucalensis TaxID=1639133 RepID=UPI00254DD2FC|nr:hypothetical protein [Citrobacter portucalensis]
MPKKEKKIIFSGAENHPMYNKPSLANLIAKRNNAVLKADLDERLTLPTACEIRDSRPSAFSVGQIYHGYTILAHPKHFKYVVRCNKCGDVMTKERHRLENYHVCKHIPKELPEPIKIERVVKAGDRFGTLTASYPTSPKIWMVRCDCGKELKLNAASLVTENNKRTSCSAPACRKRARFLLG